MLFFYSDGNFIGNVSFEGNHADYFGGKEDLEDALSALRQLFFTSPSRITFEAHGFTFRHLFAFITAT